MGLIKYKNSLSVEPFKVIDLRWWCRGHQENIEINWSYHSPLPINALKMQNLFSLLPLLDPVFHGFYNNLRTTHGGDIAGDWPDSSDEDMFIKSWLLFSIYGK